MNDREKHWNTKHRLNDLTHVLRRPVELAAKSRPSDTNGNGDQKAAAGKNKRVLTPYLELLTDNHKHTTARQIVLRRTPYYIY